MKRCPGCGEVKPWSEFHRHKSTRDGLQFRCKCCQRESQRRLAAKNRRNGVQNGGEKTCGICGETKPRTEFGVDRARKDGRSYYCRSCLVPRKLATNYRRREMRLATLREDPKAVKTCRTCGQIKPVTDFTPNSWNPDGRQHHCRDCRRPIIRSASDAWRAANPEKWSFQNREHVRRYGARVKLATADPVDLMKVLETHGMTCHICGEPITEPRGASRRSLTFDHVIPISRGGTHTEDNLRPAHFSCNSRKNARPMSEVARLYWMR